jgi:hypothetical protein
MDPSSFRERDLGPHAAAFIAPLAVVVRRDGLPELPQNALPHGDAWAA